MTIRAELTAEQALDFAARLTAAAHRVKESQKNGNPGAHAYVGTPQDPRIAIDPEELRVRIGTDFKVGGDR